MKPQEHRGILFLFITWSCYAQFLYKVELIDKIYSRANIYNLSKSHMYIKIR